MTTVVRAHPVPQDMSVKPPRWVAGLLGQAEIELHSHDDSLLIDAADVSLAMARVEDALTLDGVGLQSRVVRAYQSIAARLVPIEARHPVRFWNFIPQLNQPMGDGRDRYMAFNAGRHAAFTEWFGDQWVTASMVPTASGVGHFGSDLFIWCLASRRHGRAVENPQQYPSCCYSPRYGPLPPCFARATMIDLPHVAMSGRNILLVGGTASIRGENTVGPASLRRQTLITLQNLGLVVKAASLDSRTGDVMVNGDLRRWLACYRHLRVYFSRTQDQPTLAKLIESRLSPVQEIEWIHAPLCRPELLVEIEGVAILEEQ